MQYTDTIAKVADATWLLFIIVWIISAFSAKRAVKSSPLGLIYRIAVAFVIILIIRFAGFSAFVRVYIHNDAVRWFGAFLVVLGMALGFWARYNLGRNWGEPMTEKVGAELVTTGPYAYIRNPIYSAVMLSMIGSCLVFGLLWVVVFVAYAGYLIPSVFVEEKIMLKLFPDTYPAYKARTKRLIPWVW